MARRKYEENYEDEEPTFSLHDFKKWLQQNNGDEDSLQETNTKEFHKEELKEKFKENFKEKLRKNRKKD